MGCDIHLFVETKNEDGQWQHTEPPLEDCTWCNGSGKREWGNDGDSKPCYFCDGSGNRRNPYYEGRNYDLFAILANVRNGYGFAGVDTGDGFVPICEPKGLPDSDPETYERDGFTCSDYVKARDWEWSGAGHSHSWHTVADLLAYDWNQTTNHRGCISEDEYRERLAKGETGAPESWSGGISGPGIICVTSGVMDAIFAGDYNRDESARYFVQVEWQEKYSESAGNFLTQTLPRLQALGKPEDVRIVFWFDN